MTAPLSDAKAVFVKDWLNVVDSDIKSVRETQSNLIAREKKVSNKTLEFLDALSTLSSHEASLGLRQCYSHFIESVQSIESEHGKAIQHMERIVIQRLDEFRNLIKDQKEIVSQRNSSADKMKAAGKAIEKLAARPQRDEIKIVQSKQHLLATEMELQRDEEAMNNGVVQLESTRIDLIQDMLARYVNCSMYFHGKAIESLSGLIRQIATIDTDAEKAALVARMASLSDPGHDRDERSQIQNID